MTSDHAKRMEMTPPTSGLREVQGPDRRRELEHRLEVLEMNYLNSSWAMGPAYRRRIAEVEAELHALERN